MIQFIKIKSFASKSLAFIVVIRTLIYVMYLLNAIFRLKIYMSQKEMEVVLNSFTYSNFNYCPLAWYFSTNKSIEKIKNMHKCCLRLTLSDYKSDYRTLLDKSGKGAMKITRIKTVATEIFKTVNEINTNFLKTIFTSNSNSKLSSRVLAFHLLVKNCNTENCGSESLIMTLGSQIWNAPAANVKEKHPLANSANILSRGQVRLASAKCAFVFRN